MNRVPSSTRPSVPTFFPMIWQSSLGKAVGPGMNSIKYDGFTNGGNTLTESVYSLFTGSLQQYLTSSDGPVCDVFCYEEGAMVDLFPSKRVSILPGDGIKTIVLFSIGRTEAGIEEPARAAYLLQSHIAAQHTYISLQG